MYNRMKSFSIISLVAFAVTATASNIPDSAVLEVSSNFEFGTTYKDFRVIYPGVDDRASYNDADGGVCKEAKIKIYKDGECQAFHEYTVPGARKADAGTFYFGFKDATPGKYQVEVCHGEVCSYRTRSLTKISSEDEKGFIECYREKWVPAEGGVAAHGERTDDFFIDVIPVKELVNDTAFPALRGAKKLGLKGGENPTYKNGFVYTAVNYNISHYWKLFDVAKTEEEKAARKEEGYTADYCTRKYILIVNVHLLDSDTKEIKYRFKTSPYLTDALKDKYILGIQQNEGNAGGDAENDQAQARTISPSTAPLVPIELFYKAKVEPGNYILWISVCPSDKDAVDFSVDCSEPFIKEGFNIPSQEAAAEKPEAQEADKKE